MQSAHSGPQHCCRLFAWAFILAYVFLLAFKMPRGSVEGFPLFVSPWGALKSDPSPCSQCKLMAWRFLCSFFRRWLHLLKFFFLFLLLLLIFLSLLPLFSLPSFIAFCFLSASPSPTYVFGFLWHALQIHSYSRIIIVAHGIPVILVLFFPSTLSLLHSFLSQPSSSTS